MPKNIDALKKSFLLVIDRIEKGGKLVVSAAVQNGTSAGSSQPTNNANKATRSSIN